MQVLPADRRDQGRDQPCRPRGRLTTSIRRLVTVLAAVVLVAAACGNDDGGTPATTTGATTTTAVTTTTVAPGDALAAAAEAWGGRDVIVEGTWEQTTDGETTSGTVRLVWQPSRQRWRMDLSSTDGSGSLIATAERTLACVDAEQACAQLPATGGALPPLVAPVPGLQLLAVTDVAALAARFGAQVTTGTRTVAGREATCFSGTTAEGTGEVCFADGVLVLLRAEDAGGRITYEATAVEDPSAIDDALFEPPYPVIPMPFPPMGG